MHVHIYRDGPHVDHRREDCQCGKRPTTGVYTEHVDACRCRDCYKKRFKSIQAWRNSTPAQKRANAFFRAHLTPRQKYTDTTFGYIDVLAANGTIWRLDLTESSGNAYRLDKRTNRWFGFCIIMNEYYDEDLPVDDQFLAQLLMLRTNPRKFVTIGINTGPNNWEGVCAREWIEP